MKIENTDIEVIGKIIPQKDGYLFPWQKGSYRNACKKSKEDFDQQNLKPQKFHGDIFWAYNGFTFQILNYYEIKSQLEIPHKIMNAYNNIKKSEHIIL